MAIAGVLPLALGRSGKAVSVTQTALTGAGAITTGLNNIDTGAAVVCVANSPTSATLQTASITSIAAGTVNAVVWTVVATGPTAAVATAALSVNCIAIGEVA